MTAPSAPSARIARLAEFAARIAFGDTLSREELSAKALRLARYSGGATEARMNATLQRLWRVTEWPRVERLLAR